MTKLFTIPGKAQNAETVMNYTPVTALAVASIASTLHWITRRRQYHDRTDQAPKDSRTLWGSGRGK